MAAIFSEDRLSKIIKIDKRCITVFDVLNYKHYISVGVRHLALFASGKFVFNPKHSKHRLRFGK